MFVLCPPPDLSRFKVKLGCEEEFETMWRSEPLLSMLSCRTWWGGLYMENMVRYERIDSTADAVDCERGLAVDAHVSTAVISGILSARALC